MTINEYRSEQRNQINQNDYSRNRESGSNLMDKKPGRPPLHKTKMLSRKYQITEDQDRAIKKISVKNRVSKSSVVRQCIEAKLLC